MVALYENLEPLYPLSDHDASFRYLSKINVLMGNVQDEMMARKFDKTHDYHANTFAMPEEIRQRLTALVGHCGLQKRY